jgi:hypothetical protein
MRKIIYENSLSDISIFSYLQRMSFKTYVNGKEVIWKIFELQFGIDLQLFTRG